jgi:flagellar motor protein MotB
MRHAGDAPSSTKGRAKKDGRAKNRRVEFLILEQG